MKYILLLFFLYFLYCFYNNKKIEPFYPDERQYTICNTNDSKGDSNISMAENKIQQPSEDGFHRALIEITGEDKKGKHFNIHNCSPFTHLNKKEIEYIYDLKIIDHHLNSKDNKTLYDDLKYHYSPYDSNYSVTYEKIEDGKLDDSFNHEFIKSFNKIKESDNRF